MKIYYIQYKDSEDHKKVEAFKSRTIAQKRISELKGEVRATKKLWEEYVINGTKGTRPPKYLRELPSEVIAVEFEKDSNGMLEAFTFLVNKE